MRILINLSRKLRFLLLSMNAAAGSCLKGISMTREQYESLPLSELRQIAKARELKGVSALKKHDLIQRMLEEDAKAEPEQSKKTADAQALTERPKKKTGNAKAEPEQSNERTGYAKAESEQPKESAQDTGAEESDQIKPDLRALDSGIEVTGILEVMEEGGFGFIRSTNFLSGSDDVYVSPSQIRKFRMKTGDYIRGTIKVKGEKDKNAALIRVISINGFQPYLCSRRMNFEDMTPIFPNKRLRMEYPGGSMAMRILDLISPVGKGQRGMIVSPPKAGKTTLLKDVAKALLKNNPKINLIILLIDERPEEVTDMKETVKGENVEIIHSTFDQLPEHHKKVSEMVIERAKRLVEMKQDVVILVDSITRLTRAYNQVVAPSGRTLSGGLDPAALHMPKRFFGAARNMREGGSLTILATALVETGSKMDDVVYEEFKGTGNMELVLNRKLQERRVFPAIDIAKSGTRREDLLLNPEELEAVNHMRRALNGLKAEEPAENIMNMFARTRNNAELVQQLKKQKIV